MPTDETYVGPPIDDPEQLARVPEPFASMLRQKNGFIWFGGGLHVRGACTAPGWHSLRAASVGPVAFHELYWNVRPTDVPFAEDCMGDQFLFLEAEVVQLAAETGALKRLKVGASEFLAKVEGNPLEFPQMHPLLQFEAEGGRLIAGELLAAYPPFVAQQADEAVSLRAISADERRRFLADIANQIRDAPDGATIRFEVARESTSRRRG